MISTRVLLPREKSSIDKKLLSGHLCSIRFTRKFSDPGSEGFFWVVEVPFLNIKLYVLYHDCFGTRIFQYV